MGALWNSLQAAPERRWLVGADRTLSFGEVYALASQKADRLLDRIPIGGRVVLAVRSSMTLAIEILALDAPSSARAAAPPSPSQAMRPTEPSPPPEKPARAYRVPWADLLRKVFALDVLACPGCGSRMRLIAFIAEVNVARRILDHLGLDSHPPPIARAQAPPEALDPPPVHDLPDPVFPD